MNPEAAVGPWCVTFTKYDLGCNVAYNWYYTLPYPKFPFIYSIKCLEGETIGTGKAWWYNEVNFWLMTSERWKTAFNWTQANGQRRANASLLGTLAVSFNSSLDSPPFRPSIPLLPSIEPGQIVFNIELFEFIIWHTDWPGDLRNIAFMCQSSFLTTSNCATCAGLYTMWNYWNFLHHTPDSLRKALSKTWGQDVYGKWPLTCLVSNSSYPRR